MNPAPLLWIVRHVAVVWALICTLVQTKETNSRENWGSRFPCKSTLVRFSYSANANGLSSKLKRGSDGECSAWWVEKTKVNQKKPINEPGFLLSCAFLLLVSGKYCLKHAALTVWCPGGLVRLSEMQCESKPNQINVCPIEPSPRDYPSVNVPQIFFCSNIAQSTAFPTNSFR